MEPWTSWEYRSAFDAMMDEIGSAESQRELDELMAEVTSTFAHHPRVDELRTLITAMRRLVSAEAVARQRGFMS